MASNSSSVDSVLLIGFGGPTRPEHVLPFLKVVTCGRGIPENRLKDVEHHYTEVGGRSPYNDLTEQLRLALERWLADHGHPLPVYVGMRNWHPWIADTIHQMNRDGRRHAVGVILAAHRAESSWDRYKIDVQRGIVSNFGKGPAVSYLDACYDQPRFFEAVSQRIEESCEYRRGSWPENVPVLFAAHSIPIRSPGKDVYVSDLMASCQGVADILKLNDWELAYQSRSGSPHVPWLEPDIYDAVREQAERGAKEVVVQAIGFLSDHVEVLFDLDIELKETCEELGIRLHRAPCINDHPEFVALLGEQVLQRAGQPV